MRDDGVQEVIGFILMFALSSIILVISVQSFTTAREDSEAVLAAAELKGVATRVSTRLVEAGLVSQDFPEASFEVRIDLPRNVAGYEYKAEISPTEVKVTSLDGSLKTTSSTFRLDAYTTSNTCFAVRGSVVSSYGAALLSYGKNDGAKPPGCVLSTWQSIDLAGVS